MPFKFSRTQYEEWYDIMMNENVTLTWVRNIYWYLEEYSLVFVPRNRDWFMAVQHKFQEIWNIILKERVSGYEHRKPKKRQKKKPIVLKVDTLPFSIMNAPD